MTAFSTSSPQLLAPNEIFVFATDTAGRHRWPSARKALSYGALYGQAHGLVGKSFALRFFDPYGEQLTRVQIVSELNLFNRFVSTRATMRFHVANIQDELKGDGREAFMDWVSYSACCKRITHCKRIAEVIANG